MTPRRTGPLVVVGDTLLDRDITGEARRLSPDAPVPVLEDPSEQVRPGGAALTALLAAHAGREVVLITPLGDDDCAHVIRQWLDGIVKLIELPWADATAQKVRMRADGNTLLRVDRPARRYDGTPPEEAARAIAGAGAVLVSDYGNGAAASPELRHHLTDHARRAPLVWDPHPRGAAPVPGTRLATPNQAEAAALGETPELLRPRRPAGSNTGGRPEPGNPGLPPTVFGAAVEAAYRMRTKWPVDQLCVTLGAQGALLLGDSGPFYASAPQVAVRDACGAGDFFAGALAAALCDGALTTEAVAEAVARSADFLAAGGVAALESGARFGAEEPSHGPAADGFAIAEAVRERGGTVVATGGCFDLLHAGHVQCLQAARRAGDCLIVCLNSDSSARALKGEGRPLNNAADRAAVLASLDCVDAVVVFDEPQPTEILRRLRPDVWVKGGDYDPKSLPETPLVRSWGGQVLAVPYLSGRSTTRLVHAARSSARI